jgi:hypothetical protein
MKRMCMSLLALLVLSESLPAQRAVYPLHIGNIWQYSHLYFDRSGPIVDTKTTTVVGDTIMSNGKQYAVVSDWGYPGFMRQQGDSVLAWSPNGEWVLFDFSLSVGESIITYPAGPGDTTFIAATSRDSLTVFGARRCVWTFLRDEPHTIDDERSFRVVDGIGTIDISFSWGSYSFQGARIDGVVYGTLLSAELPVTGVPEVFTLEQNYPNPFNPTTTIRYGLPRRGHIHLAVFNSLGQRVATLVQDEREAGFHEVVFDASRVASGVYYCTMNAANSVLTRKLLLIR